MPESVVQYDTIPSQYRDAKTGKIKGSFQIDINGDTAIFKDVRSKKELFKVPLSELAGPANKVIAVEGFPLHTEKKFIFISSDSMTSGALTAPSIIINGSELSPADLDKINPTSIKTIDLRGNEKGVIVSEKNINGMILSETTSADGKKVITVKMDSVIFDGKPKIAVPAHGNVSNIFVLGDTSAGKKTYTFVQKSTEKTELPKDVLYIIDGKEKESGSMKDVDPTTIKSINVLKGENAVKKYGEKAKNGVIEITTKKN
jgi:hypothetical protein